MKYLRKFNSLDEYNEEFSSLHLPNVSLISQDNILKYKSIKSLLMESLVAWYSPKKQGLNNFDIIESYVEDFTKWEYRSYRGTANITSNRIIITNVTESNNIIEDSKEPYSNMTVYVTGVTEDKYLIVRKGRDRPEVHVKKNGVYSFDDNNYFFGFGVSKVGDCNISIIQLPTSILKDISGNENHSYIYGSKGKLNGGVGLYKEDFTTYMVQGGIVSSPSTVYPSKVIIPNSDEYISDFWKNIRSSTTGQVTHPGFKFRLTGLPKGSQVNISMKYGDDYSQTKNIIAIADEITTIPEVTGNVITTGNTYTYISFNLRRYKNTITIEQIPDYPNQICYDGKMYAVSYDFPILTDYTVIADRTWFDININTIFINNTYLDDAENRGFLFEQIRSESTIWSTSYGVNNELDRAPDGICYQSKNSYNGTHINSGSKRFIDLIVIGAYLNNTLDRFMYSWKGCHGDVMIFNRTLSSDEIKVAKALMLSDSIN